MSLEKRFGFGRNFLFGAVIATALCFESCSKDKESDVLSPGGTGVKGLNTPSEILSNPYIKKAVKTAEDEGLEVTPEEGVHPPVISGTYDLGGVAYFPIPSRLASGTWVWSKQTSDNHINTDYNQQGLQIGANVEGEIIRGTDDQFTVYSILEISQSGYNERAAVLVDGKQDNKGDVSAVYIATGVKENSALIPSGGKLELTLKGPTASAGKRKFGGAYLIDLIKNRLKIEK
ncbi:MAG: hypothetical protein AABY10_05885 [Nanoarchaeota archaeon]